MSAVLQAPIVVFSDIATEPQYFAFPDVISSKATTIIVHWSELNHYEAAVPVPDCIPGSTLPATTPKADGFCSCGVNKKGSSAKSCCQSPVYSTRCK